MLVRLTNPYRAHIADALTGVASTAHRPAGAVIGNAAAGRPPAEALYDPTPTVVSAAVTRAANHTVVVVVTVPLGAPTQFDEIGITAEDGTLLLHATLPAQSYATGVEVSFEFTFNPEVYDA